MHEEIAIKGSPIAIKNRIFLLTKLFRQNDIIKSEKIIIRIPEEIPKKRLNLIEVIILWRASFLLFDSRLLDIIHVITILIPDVAIVTKNKYTDIIRVKIPIDSAFNLLERYTLNPREINLIKNVEITKIVPFINKIFDFLKISPINDIQFC